MILYDIMQVTDPVECVSLLGVPVNEKDLTSLLQFPVVRHRWSLAWLQAKLQDLIQLQISEERPSLTSVQA